MAHSAWPSCSFCALHGRAYHNRAYRYSPMALAGGMFPCGARWEFRIVAQPFHNAEWRPRGLFVSMRGHQKSPKPFGLGLNWRCRITYLVVEDNDRICRGEFDFILPPACVGRTDNDTCAVIRCPHESYGMCVSHEIDLAIGRNEVGRQRAGSESRTARINEGAHFNGHCSPHSSSEFSSGNSDSETESRARNKDRTRPHRSATYPCPKRWQPSFHPITSG